MISKAYEKIFKDHYLEKCKYLKYYKRLALDEKAILLESFEGHCFDGNIYHLAKELTSNDAYQDFAVYVAVQPELKAQAQMLYTQRKLDNVKFVTILTDEYYKLMASAKYLINDSAFLPFFIKKEGQVYLNTWHGTPLKTLGKSMKNGSYTIGNVQKNLVAADYILFPNEFTKQHMVEDFMLENLSEATALFAGLPRNKAFFDEELSKQIRVEYGLSNKEAIAYMPTSRGFDKNHDAGMMHSNCEYIFEELDKKLNDNQVLFVNLHPLEGVQIDFAAYKKIKPFPCEYETYEFLSACDVLVSDYSSVLFDFLNSGKKTILYAYDEKYYSSYRGMYMDLHELPFPVVKTVAELVSEINNPKQYDDAAARNMFCQYDTATSVEHLCEHVILNKNNNLVEQSIPNNGKENVFIFAGRLEKNEITASLMHLLNTIDLDKRNYILTMQTSKAVVKNFEQLHDLSLKVNYFPIKGTINLSVWKKIVWMLNKKGLFPNSLFLKLMKYEYQCEFKRMYGNCKIDSFVHFTGYNSAMINLVSQFSGNKVIFEHADMQREVEARAVQRKGVLKSALSCYDHIALVSEDFVEPMAELVGSRNNITVCRNFIDNKAIVEKAQLPIELGENTEIYPNLNSLHTVLNSDAPIFINIGRFSPEKGQLRLLDAFAEVLKDCPAAKLIIMGGNSVANQYISVKEHIEELGLRKHVILIHHLPNPCPIVNRANYFVMSSTAEGFGLVIAEAAALGKAVIAPNIPGPRSFMKACGGTMVENSTQGLVDGMRKLLSGEIKPMNVDYEQYNRVALDEFDSLFN